MSDFSSIELQEDLYGKIRGQFFTKRHSFYPTDYNDLTAMGIADTSTLYNGISNGRKDSYNYYHRVEEYKDMNKALPELDAIYTLYSDEATTEDLFRNKMIWAESKQESTTKEANDLLEFLEIDYYLPMIAYNLASMGNAYLELDIQDAGVSRVVVHDVLKIKRIELPDHTVLGFALVKDIRVHIDYKTFLKAIAYKKTYLKEHQKINKGKIKEKFGFFPYHEFEMIHFRLKKYSSFESYGFSVMDALRGHWQNNVLSRTSMISERITRGTTRRKILVEVGKTTNMKDVYKKMKDVGSLFKRKRFFTNSEVKLNYNPFSEQEDLIIPLQDGQPMYEIDEIQGRDITPKIDDVEYNDKTVTAVSLIPKSVLNGENEGRATIAQENSRFAKRVYNVQTEMTRGIKKIIDVHLITDGKTLQNLLDLKLKVKMNYTSDTAKLIQIETMNQIIGYYREMEFIFPDKERYYKAFGIPEEQSEEIMKEIRKNKIRVAIDDVAAEIEADKFKTKNTPKEKEGGGGWQLTE